LPKRDYIAPGVEVIVASILNKPSISL